MSVGIQVQSLALFGGLRIQSCHKLWCRSQMQLQSGVSLTVAQAGSCSSDFTASLGTFMCHKCGHKKKKKKRPEQTLHQRWSKEANKYMERCSTSCYQEKKDQYLPGFGCQRRRKESQGIFRAV